MREKLIRGLKSDLVKTSALNGLANCIQILISLITNKISAVYLGPAGVALMGQFTNFTSMAMQFATVGISSGVTKYTAEYYDNPEKRRSILSTGLMLVIVGALIVSIVVFLGRFYFSDSLLHTRDYVSIFTIFSVTLILFALNVYFMSVLNGHKEFKKVVSVNISNSVLGLIVAVVLIIRYGLYGAFLGVVLSQSAVCFITIFFVVRSKWFRFENLFSGFSRESLFKLLKFTLMAFTSVFTITFVQLQIRSYIISHISIEDAGLWQGVTRISDLYLNLIITTLSIYYLPKLSESKTNDAIRKELKKGYLFILPMAIISALSIFFLKDFIINALYSKRFLPMKDLFAFQLLGDVFKISSWLLGYLLIAKAKTKLFIAMQIIFGVAFYTFTIFFVHYYGVIGATYSYALTYFFFLLLTIYIFRDLLFKRGIHESRDYGFSGNTDI